MRGASSTLTDVFRPGGHGPPQLGHKLLGVQPYFDDVVEQSEERSQREGRHEERDEAKLDDWDDNNTEDVQSLAGNVSFPRSSAGSPTSR